MKCYVVIKTENQYEPYYEPIEVYLNKEKAEKRVDELDLVEKNKRKIPEYYYEFFECEMKE